MTLARCAKNDRLASLETFCFAELASVLLCHKAGLNKKILGSKNVQSLKQMLATASRQVKKTIVSSLKDLNKLNKMNLRYFIRLKEVKMN